MDIADWIGIAVPRVDRFQSPCFYLTPNGNMILNFVRVSQSIFILRKMVCALPLAIAFAVGCQPDQRDQQSQPAGESKSTSTNGSIPSAPSELPAERDEVTSEEPKRVMVRVNVTGFQQSDGVCRIAIYLGPKHFNNPEFAIAKESVEIHDSTASTAIIVEIPSSLEQTDAGPLRLAVSAYHDQNGNSQLDKNSFGIPTELYGFSNNPKRGFGPPKFNDVAGEIRLPMMLAEPLDVPITVK